MKIYTKTGDKGETGLAGGVRVPKTDPRIEALGTIDELNGILGVIIAAGSNQMATDARKRVCDLLVEVQKDLFHIGSLISEARETSLEARINWLEERIDALESALPALKNFILPGGSKAAAFLHFARTICRRAERRVVAIKALEPARYCNRLSDFLFVLARYANKADGTQEVVWRA